MPALGVCSATAAPPQTVFSAAAIDRRSACGRACIDLAPLVAKASSQLAGCQGGVAGMPAFCVTVYHRPRRRRRCRQEE